MMYISILIDSPQCSYVSIWRLFHTLLHMAHGLIYEYECIRTSLYEHWVFKFNWISIIIIIKWWKLFNNMLKGNLISFWNENQTTIQLLPLSVIIKYRMCLMSLGYIQYSIQYGTETFNNAFEWFGKLFQFSYFPLWNTGVLILVIIYAAMGSILFVTLEGDDDIMGKTVETAVAASKPRTDLVNADMRSR